MPGRLVIRKDGRGNTDYKGMVMNDHEDRMITEAVAWHAASLDDNMDWTGFTAWLEADPRHVCAYDEIALAGALIDDHRAVLLAALGEKTVDQDRPEPEPLADRRRKWGHWAGLAIAASLAAIFLVPQFVSQPAVYGTQEKSQRIVLDDGSAVTLAPHSRLAVSGSAQDEIALTGGAWFDIRHHPGRALRIRAGQLEITDIGTRFDVQAEAGNVRIGVVEGKVAVASQALAQPIRLESGRSLLFDSHEGSAIVRSLALPEIGAWRSGRLSYEDTPLPLVLDDLSRYAGVQVTLPDSLRNRHFAGSLIINDGDAAIRDLAEVMDLELGRSGGVYSLRERNR